MNSSIEHYLLRFFLILFPFHYFIFSIILADYDFLKYWKEIILIIICTIIFKKQRNIFLDYKKWDFTLFDLSILLFVVPVIFSFLFLTENKTDGLYMIRVYFQPLIIYFIARNIYMTENHFNKLTNTLLNVGIVLAVYGLFQSIALGEQFLLNLEYPTKFEGRLKDSFYISGFGDFQRVVSTFVNPNVAALYMSFLLILIFMNFRKLKNRKLMFGVTLLFLAIFFTFSRSTWIPLFIVAIFVISYLWKTHPNLKKILLYSPIIFTFLLSIFSILFNLNIFGKLYSFVYRSLTLEDTSAAGRTQIWNHALGIIRENIFGIGMGQTGAKATVLGNDSIPSESSYLTILLDFGIQGFIPFILLFVSVLYISFRNLKQFNKNEQITLINMGCLLATIMILIAMMVSNYIHDIELLTLYYLIIGLGSNKHLYRSIIGSKYEL
jgi:O-antigen ligase